MRKIGTYTKQKSGNAENVRAKSEILMNIIKTPADCSPVLIMMIDKKLVSLCEVPNGIIDTIDFACIHVVLHLPVVMDFVMVEFNKILKKPLAGINPHHAFFLSCDTSTAMGARSEKKQLKHQHPDVVASKPRPAFFKKKSVLTNTRLAPVEDADPDFPRGGASLLSRQETTESLAEVEDEFEREVSQQGYDNKKKKKKGSSKAVTDDPDAELGSLFGDGLTGKLHRFTNHITLKNNSLIMKILVVIVEVNSKDLVINLPGGLRGYIRADEESNISLDARNKDSENHLLSSIFHIGQLVSGIMLRLDDDKRSVSLYLALCCGWMMTRGREKEIKESGCQHGLACHSRALRWMLFKMEWS